MTKESEQPTRQWSDEAEEALDRTVSAVRTAWEGTRESRMSALETAREAIRRLADAIDEGIELGKGSWGQSADDSANREDEVVVDIGEEERLMGSPDNRVGGTKMLPEHVNDRSEASGWLPAVITDDWPPVETRRAISSRRQDLYDAMRRVERAAARANGQADWIEQVRDAVGGLESALDRHQRETEAPDGLFAEIVDQSPHLVPAVDSLREEHREMASKCYAIRDSAAEPDVSPAELRRGIVGLLGNIMMHRQNGAELVFDACNVDLGTGE